jgi:membrane protein DedA with SNARE-associated domain
MDHYITHAMTSLGHVGVALLMFLENVFPPLPSELIMPLAGFAAARGDLSLVGVIVAGSLGSLAGQFPLYYLGRAVGEHRLHYLADRYGKWVTLSGHDVDRAADWLRRRGAVAIFLCRLVPGVRSLISIPAGASRMNLPLFTLYSTLGITLWSSLLAGLGYLLGDNYRQVEQTLGALGNALWITLAALLLTWIAWRIRGCFLHARADCPFHEPSA